MWKDISTAPKSSFKQVNVGKGGVREVIVPERILALTSDRQIIMTWWLPDVGRWNFFAENVPPKVWWDFGDGLGMPPLPPEEEAYNG